MASSASRDRQASSDSSQGPSLKAKMTKEEALELLRSASDCLIRARARVVKVLDSTKERQARSDLFIALGRLNMAMRIIDELRSKLG
jgi:hypothetical protein